AATARARACGDSGQPQRAREFGVGRRAGLKTFTTETQRHREKQDLEPPRHQGTKESLDSSFRPSRRREPESRKTFRFLLDSRLRGSDAYKRLLCVSVPLWFKVF